MPGVHAVVRGVGQWSFDVAIEHKAVLEAVHQAAHEGADERLCTMTDSGLIDAASFDSLLRDDVGDRIGDVGE